jgi:carbon monoxide dehydrogenase subunit G
VRRENATVTVERPPQEVFDWIADYRNVPRVLDGVQRWQPVGGKRTGVGATYDVRLGVLGIGLGTRIKLTRWEPPRLIEFASSGAGFEGSWRLRPRGDATDVTLTLGFDVPGGALGGFLAGRVEGVLRARVLKALERMKDAIEA